MQYFDIIFSGAPTTSVHQYPAYDSAPFSSTQAEVRAAECYVEQFRDRPKFSDLLKNILLTEEQENLLRQYKDPRTLEVVDLPVKLHDNHYNLQTVLEDYNSDQKSPVGQKPFAISDIKKASKVYDGMKAIIDGILANQEPEDQPSTGYSIS